MCACIGLIISCICIFPWSELPKGIVCHLWGGTVATVMVARGNTTASIYRKQNYKDFRSNSVSVDDVNSFARGLYRCRYSPDGDTDSLKLYGRHSIIKGHKIGLLELNGVNAPLLGLEPFELGGEETENQRRRLTLIFTRSVWNIQFHVFTEGRNDFIRIERICVWWKWKELVGWLRQVLAKQKSPCGQHHSGNCQPFKSLLLFSGNAQDPVPIALCVNSSW